jgi:hypothetical protein
VKRFYTYLSGAQCSLDIYRLCAGLAVTGPTRDVLQSAFQQQATAAAAAQLLSLVILLIAHLERPSTGNTVMLSAVIIRLQYALITVMVE